MRVDSFGVVHPEPKDEPTLVGVLHISECGPCQQVFAADQGPEFLLRVSEVAAAAEAEMRERAKHRRRQHA